MKSNFVLRLAYRYFSAKKSIKLVSFISGFSLMGVMLGVAALIVVMSVMEGFHIELTSNIISLGGDINIASNSSTRITNYSSLASEIEKVEGVQSVVPQIQSKALAISGSNSYGVMVRGMDIKGILTKSQIINHQLLGDISQVENTYNIAIGNELAQNLGARLGDDIILICPSTVSTMLGNLPRKKTFKLVSIFSSGMFDYDSATIIMSLASAQKLFSLNNAVNYIEIYTDDANNPENFTSKIQRIVGPELYVNSWKDNNGPFLNALKIERVAMFTILSLIIIVAAFNIISSQFMLVNEKRKDIAILKTMGATPRQILLIFITNGSFIGILGTSLGALLGIGFASNIESIRNFLQKITNSNIFDAAIYYLYHLPAKIIPGDILMISLMSVLLCIVATIYPAYKAASIDPSEALRNE